MNPNTRVSVHCYKGDMPQVTGAMPIYLHHECPVVIMSPDDEYRSKSPMSIAASRASAPTPDKTRSTGNGCN